MQKIIIKFISVVTLLIAAILLDLHQASAQTYMPPTVITISCAKGHVSFPPLSSVNVQQGFGGKVPFKVQAGTNVQLVGPLTWVYPIRGAGDPDWGAWVGQGTNTLNWTPPKTGNAYGSFRVSVSGKARCTGGGPPGGTGGGVAEEFTFSAEWEGTVTADWKFIPNIGYSSYANNVNTGDTAVFQAVIGGITYPVGGGAVSSSIQAGQQIEFRLNGLQDSDTLTTDGTTESGKIATVVWNANIGTFAPQNNTENAGSITGSTIVWTAPNPLPKSELAPIEWTDR